MLTPRGVSQQNSRPNQLVIGRTDVYMCVPVYMCTRSTVSLFMCVCVCLCMYACMYVPMYMCTRSTVGVFMCVFTCVSVCMCLYVRVSSLYVYLTPSQILQLEKEVDNKKIGRYWNWRSCRRLSLQFHVFGYFAVLGEAINSKSSNAQVSLRVALDIPLLLRPPTLKCLCGSRLTYRYYSVLQRSSVSAGRAWHTATTPQMLSKQLLSESGVFRGLAFWGRSLKWWLFVLCYYPEISGLDFICWRLLWHEILIKCHMTCSIITHKKTTVICPLLAMIFGRLSSTVWIRFVMRTSDVEQPLLRGYSTSTVIQTLKPELMF